MSLRPTKLSEILGNRAAVDLVREAVTSPEPVDDLLLYGSSSTGKTLMLTILQTEFSETVHFIDGREIGATKMENIKKGLESPYNVSDFFRGVPQKNKKVIIICDDIEDAGLSKLFFKKPRAVQFIGTTSAQSFRSFKASFKTKVLLVRPTTTSLVGLVSTLRGWTRPAAKMAIDKNVNDIRGLLQECSVCDSNPLRDPREDTVSCLMRTQADVRKNGGVTEWNYRQLESDRYNLKFHLFENYPDMTTNIEGVSESFSASDRDCLEHNDSGYFTALGVVVPLVQLTHKVNKRGRVSKLVSRKNQSIINRNRVRACRALYSPTGTCSLGETYLISKIKAVEADKNVIWMNKQFEIE